MKLTVALHRRLAWANVPATLLVALLQRTPMLRVASTAGEWVIASPISGVLRSAVAAAASLGVLHTLVGASGTIDANPANLVTPAGQPSAGAAFDVPDAENISSWQVQDGSMIPPGMNLSGGTAGGGPPLTAPGSVDVNDQVAVLTGTPTVPGTYNIFLVAWDGPDGMGDFNTPAIVYQVVVTGVPAVPPSFTLAASPSAATVGTGRSAVFNAIATGTPAPAYQWTLNGSTTIPGATVTNDPILVITGATSADSGPIVCTATNSAGTATSSAALTVTTTSTPGYLTNLSGRGLVGVGAANGLFGGFGIAGTGSKQLLIRGIGPRLAMDPFDVADALLDTQLTLYAGSPPTQIAFNSPWGGTAALIAADNLVGAYAVPTNSLDSMLYPSPLAAATYSAAVSGVGTDIGDAVVELYDADAEPPPARLINVSVRAPVGTGGDILFGGFVIGGTTDETVLIRGIGPRLAASPFNLTGVLAQPVLTLFAGSTPIYSNTGWGGDPALANAENTVGAYALPTNSADSLLLVTLPPGGYSAEISGVNNTTGIAVVEVYEVH